MIRIKAVDAQNILEVCKLRTNQDGLGATMERHSCCNAMSIAEAKYYPEMHPNAIYNNNVLIGFFMYQRAENQASTATICRFMIDDQFQHKGFEEKAFEHVLRGLKIQGIKKVTFTTDGENRIAEKLCLSFGFHFMGKHDNDKYCYELEF